jgi:hypothetical protein
MISIRSAVVVLVVLCAPLLTACGGSTSAPASATRDTATASPTTASVDTNVAACDEARTIVLDDIKPAFAGFGDDNGSLFDETTARIIRDGATKLFGQEAKATGSQKTAIHDEAASLVDLSIAMEGHDIDGVGDAAQRSNAALAALRGVCGF